MVLSLILCFFAKTYRSAPMLLFFSCHTWHSLEVYSFIWGFFLPCICQIGTFLPTVFLPAHENDTPASVGAHWPRNLNSSLPLKEAGWSPLTSFFILQSHNLFLEVKIKTHPVPWGSSAFCPELQNAQRDILESSTYIL